MASQRMKPTISVIDLESFWNVVTVLLEYISNVACCSFPLAKRVRMLDKLAADREDVSLVVIKALRDLDRTPMKNR